MLIDNNLIAYEYFKDQYTPKSVYPSGERDENRTVDKYNFSSSKPPVLVLKDDIINKDGLGLKRGFYNVLPDKYLDYLCIYQSGNLKAKIPVYKMEILETGDSKPQKVKKMSAKKYEKEKMRESRKYLKGENPDEIEWSEATIEYDFKLDAWILIYSSDKLELTGVIKF